MLKDLAVVLQFIKKTLEEINLIDLYENFANTLQQIAESSTDELQAQLREYKKQIQEAHRKLEPNGWSHTKLQIFGRFGAGNLLGRLGYERFKKALDDNAANPRGAVEEIKQQKEQITQLLTNTNNILASLGNLIEDVQKEEDQAVVQIIFDKEVAIEDLTQLSSHSQEWKNIIRAYSLLANSGPEKTKIISVNKGSPLTFILGTLPLISAAIYHTAKPLLDLYKEVLEMKKDALKFEEAKLEIGGKRLELFKAIDKFAQKRMEEIMKTVAKNYHVKDLDEGKLNEAKSALLKAGPDLYDFITKGGKIDATKEEKSSKSSSNFQLEADYQEAYQLENKLQLLLESKSREERNIKDGDRSKKKTDMPGNVKKRRLSKKKKNTTEVPK